MDALDKMSRTIDTGDSESDTTGSALQLKLPTYTKGLYHKISV